MRAASSKLLPGLATLCLSLKFVMAGTSSTAAELAGKATLEPVRFSDLKGWRSHQARDAWPVFIRSCRHILSRAVPLRPAVAISDSLIDICKRAEELPAPATHHQARRYFEQFFQPHIIKHVPQRNPYAGGFLTGYYEPVVAGSITPSSTMSEPVLGRPHDLVSNPEKLAKAELPAGISGARLDKSGKLEPYPERAVIENNGLVDPAPPLLYVRDGIELFMMQVQGSARIRLHDGRTLRLGYAGRNGQPYTSIGRILVDKGAIPKDEMSLARLKAWVREHGQKAGDAGRLLMQQNKSYVFFQIDDALAPELGPVGGAGVPLTPMRSIAIDRSIWPYGLPFWIDAEIPWRDAARGRAVPTFHQLMIAQDTGSAILGAARADIYFGTGTRVGRLAGNIRHSAKMFVLLPRKMSSANE